MTIDWSKPLEVKHEGEWVPAQLNESCQSPDRHGDYYLSAAVDLEYNAYLPTGQAWIEGEDSEIIVRNREETVQTIVDDDQFPADWAIERAIESLDFPNGWTCREVKDRFGEEGCNAKYIIVTARLIEQHENPPVDPDLLIAREAAAVWYEARGVENAAAEYRNGFYDKVHDRELNIALTAIRLVREGWKPE